MPSIAALLEQAVLMHRAGQLHSAKSAYVDILQQAPQQPNANYNLAVIHLQEQQIAASLPLFKAALESDPQEPLYWLGYIEALLQAANYEEARQVLAYGVQAGLSGAEVDALQAALNPIPLNPFPAKISEPGPEMPGDAEEQGLIELFAQQRYAELEEKLASMVEQHPGWLNGWKIWSDTLMVQGKDARWPASQALQLVPNDAQEHCYYGLVLRRQGDIENAAKSFERAIALKPEYAAAYNNLGIVQKDLGDSHAAIASYRQALALNPGYSDCFSNMLFCMTHAEHISASVLFREHRQFSRRYEAALKPQWPVHGNQRDAARKLRVGFVSADFREHSIANFLEPVLPYLALSHGLSLHAYCNSAIEDEVTLRLRSHFAHWTLVDRLSDQMLAEAIKHDGIDILIDLSGHTSGNRLLAFARKPAPVQASWLGYLHSTGLDAIDYYIGDHYQLPPGLVEPQFSEKLVRLPANAPFAATAHAPAVHAAPCTNAGYITFACFNRPNKINIAVVKLWSRLLHELPDAKLLLGAMPEAGVHPTLHTWFMQQGIAADRLIYHPRTGIVDYLALHHRVDICLDTFPSNGVTTTCHAAWMGVPTLTLQGGSMVSRGAMAVMSHLSLNHLSLNQHERIAMDDSPGFVAADEDEFIRLGIYWAQHADQLAAIRAGLRQRLERSALGQPELIAKSLENAMRVMWQRCCMNRPAQAISSQAI